MPKEQNRKIEMLVSKTEKQFLEFCRRIQYAEGQLSIIKGEPIKLLNPVKSVRFDLYTGNQEMPLTED